MTRFSLSSFYARMAMLLIVIVLTGFAPFVFERFRSGGTMGFALAGHSISYMLWCILLLVQAGLIAGRNIKLHMTLGKTSLMLALVMILTAVLVTQQSFARGSTGGTPFSPEHFIMLPIMDMLLFAGFYSAGFLKRKQALTHKHLMLFASIMMLDPATGRLGLILGLPPLGILFHFAVVALVWVHDHKSAGAAHSVTKWATLLLVIRYGLFFTIGGTEAWAAFAHKIFGAP